MDHQTEKNELSLNGHKVGYARTIINNFARKASRNSEGKLTKHYLFGSPLMMLGSF